MSHKKLILIADDEVAIHDSLRLYLQREGYEVYSVFRGTDVMEAFQRMRPDLVILDIMMPGRSGTEVCAEIRAISMPPVIILTAKGEEADRLLGFALGARGSLSLIKDGADKLEVRAEFDTAGLSEELKQKYLLQQNSVVLSRSLDRNGKGKSFINARPVSVAELAELGKCLVDFHGQHEHQSLLPTFIQTAKLCRCMYL